MSSQTVIPKIFIPRESANLDYPDPILVSPALREIINGKRPLASRLAITVKSMAPLLGG